MQEMEKRRALKLVKQLHVAEGVVACSTEELFVVSYPKEDLRPLLGFTKRDLEAAIELKLLGEGEVKNIGAQECRVYMKTDKAANED